MEIRTTDFHREFVSKNKASVYIRKEADIISVKFFPKHFFFLFALLCEHIDVNNTIIWLI